jgi:excisionase family DNA binding protein
VEKLEKLRDGRPAVIRKTDATERAFLGTHQVARLLDVDAGTVIRWVDAGEMAGFRTPGGHRRIPRQEVVRFMERHGWLQAGEGRP